MRLLSHRINFHIRAVARRDKQARGSKLASTRIEDEEQPDRLADAALLSTPSGSPPTFRS